MLSLPIIILITTKSILLGLSLYKQRYLKKDKNWVETEILIAKTIILLIKLPTLNEMDL